MQVVIAGSATLQKHIQKWIHYWNSKDGYSVLDYPKLIPKKDFKKLYPNIHKNFFKNIIESDILFVANERKNNIDGYIGAETFAEVAFAVIQKIVYKKKIKIILAHKPSSKVNSFSEISLWLKLGWIDKVIE